MDRRTKKILTNDKKRAIAESLLNQSTNGKVRKGSMTIIAAQFSISTRTVRRIWHQVKTNVSTCSLIDVSQKIPNKIGPKRIQIDPSQIQQIPLRRRKSIRALAGALGISKTTVHRIYKSFLRRNSNAVKPHLTDENKKTRLQFCLSMLESYSLNSGNPRFVDTYFYVHVDETWFYMTKESERYYLLPDEDETLRTVQSKKFITKVMFLAAVARPRFDEGNREVFSGKIGIFPFVTKEPAKCSSKNRVAGTMMTKPIQSITKEVYKSYLIEKVLSAIFIQEDNAKPHIYPDDIEFNQAATGDRFDIQLCFQPPNIPDMNVLDLEFFRAIQSLQYQEAPKTIDELIDAVQKSFEELSSESLNNIFLSLQLYMVETMKVQGSNNYKLPHIEKSKLMQLGFLPNQVECNRQIVDDVLQYLSLGMN